MREREGGREREGEGEGERERERERAGLGGEGAPMLTKRLLPCVCADLELECFFRMGRGGWGLSLDDS